MLIADYDHHPLVDTFNLIGHIVAQYILLYEIDAMPTAKCGFYNGHTDIGDQGNAKTEKCGTGISQCVDFRIQIPYKASLLPATNAAVSGHVFGD